MDTDMQFRFICAHLHAGNLFVLGKVDDEGSVVLWSRSNKTHTREEAEQVGKSLAAQYGCPFGCTDPWELSGSTTYQPEGNVCDVN